jgi:hypothetical protein
MRELLRKTRRETGVRDEWRLGDGFGSGFWEGGSVGG